jgi:hypothetical protein
VSESKRERREAEELGCAGEVPLSGRTQTVVLVGRVGGSRSAFGGLMKLEHDHGHASCLCAGKRERERERDARYVQPSMFLLLEQRLDYTRVSR